MGFRDGRAEGLEDALGGLCDGHEGCQLVKRDGVNCDFELERRIISRLTGRTSLPMPSAGIIPSFNEVRLTADVMIGTMTPWGFGKRLSRLGFGRKKSRSWEDANSCAENMKLVALEKSRACRAGPSCWLCLAFLHQWTMEIHHDSLNDDI